MPGVAVSLTGAEELTIALAVVLMVLVALIGYRAWKTSRVTPEERERRRRLSLVTYGKMGDATLVDVRENLLFYSYQVRGVEYTASQDVTGLRQFLPGELSVDGPVSVKYDPRNPANSIIVAEEWSGLRASKVG